MKRLIILILLIIGFTGCVTKIYLGKSAETEDQVLSDDGPLLRAIDPTIIPAGGTWGSVRSIINTNFANINGTLDSIEVNLEGQANSISANQSAIAL